MSQYGKAIYWEERYTNTDFLRDPDPFDWYQRFSGIKDQITPHFNPESTILNVGCGNSRLSEEMFDEGYQKITNIDISKVVIKAMQEKCKDKQPELKYLEMDARNMDFKDDTFDCVINKATMDAILCGENSLSNVASFLSEIYRVLKPKGVFITVSYGTPENRECYLKKPEFDWTVTNSTVYKPTISTSIQITSQDKDSPSVHYIYVCKKGSGQGGGMQMDK